VLHRAIFKLGYSVKRPNVLKYYNDFKDNPWLPFEELKAQQEMALRNLIDFAYDNVPYYTNLFRKLELKPSDIKTTNDLQKLPTLNKHIIKENWQDFLPENIHELDYLDGSTSGSTGTPFKYRMSREDYERGVALLYRGWGFGGYELADNVAIIGGSALLPTASTSMRARLQEFFRHQKFYSSFAMGDEELRAYVRRLNKQQPQYLRGYAASMALLAQFVLNSKSRLTFQPKGVFTTAEKLFADERQLIEKTFNCEVFDNYGLNDGGVSAYECGAHSGLHICTERSILEVVDEDGKQLINKQGKILATSLHNYALPFIRYETGDLGAISDSPCSCGRPSPVLKEIAGRVSEFITTPSGLRIHGEFFSHVFYEFENVVQFQVVQNNLSEILINIVPENVNRINDMNINKIRDTILQKDKELNIGFAFVKRGELEYTQAGKYKFIINNLTREREDADEQ